jgi:hypothetical protein
MAALNTKTNNATGELIHDDENPIRSQRCGFTAEQIAAPQTVLYVAEERQPGWEPDSGAELFSAVRTNLPVRIMRPANPRFTTAISRGNFPQFPARNFPQLDNPATSEHNLARVLSKLPRVPEPNILCASRDPSRSNRHCMSSPFPLKARASVYSPKNHTVC